MCALSCYSQPWRQVTGSSPASSSSYSQTLWLGDHSKRLMMYYGQSCWNGDSSSPFFCIEWVRVWSKHLKVEVRRGASSAVWGFSEFKTASSRVSSPRKVWIDAYDDIFSLEHHTQSRHKAGLLCGTEDEYAKQLPCSSCRGRGYVRCEECDIVDPRVGCSICAGKGFRTCSLCLGERVVWEKTLNESSWNNIKTISFLKVPDDEAIENMEIPIVPLRKSKRVYGPLSIETREKIRRALKDLERRTGLFSKRMKNFHKDPILHAERIAAIKEAKGTPEARQRISAMQKQYFSDPENRRKRSIRMKGVKFFCKNCGEEGHKKNKCPKFKTTETILQGPRPYRCRFCLEIGHQYRTCPKNPNSKSRSSLQKASNLSTEEKVKASPKQLYKCRCCYQIGHSKRSCPNYAKSSIFSQLSQPP